MQGYGTVGHDPDLDNDPTLSPQQELSPQEEGEKFWRTDAGSAWSISSRQDARQEYGRAHGALPWRGRLPACGALFGLFIILPLGLYIFVLNIVVPLPEKGLVSTASPVKHALLVKEDAPLGDADGTNFNQERDSDEVEENTDSMVLDELHTLSWRRRKSDFTTGDKSCATVEEMGEVTVGLRAGVERASLKIRRLIQEHFAVHGAETVRKLPAEDFCRRGFVGEALLEMGLGNCLYKTVTAAALSMMLGRSLILSRVNGFNQSFNSEGEEEDVFGFQDYISNTEQAFTLREVRRLWAKHGCDTTFQRPLHVRIYNSRDCNSTRELCDDWSTWPEPIIRYALSEDSTALQMFLKSRVPAMRARSYRLLGPTNDPNLRPNLFGELLNFVHAPTRAVEEAVNWTLGAGGDPDVTVHLRVMHRSDQGIDTSAWCVRQVLEQFPKLRANGRKPRVAVVSDTAAAIPVIREALGDNHDVVWFDYKAWMAAFPEHETMNANKLPVPKYREGDWGAAPRWVGIVDFYLAARARVAVISTARRRVATTFAQLIAALAAARQLGAERSRDDPQFTFYSSFQEALLLKGLSRQWGRSFAWHPFSGNLSCMMQGRQCARTAILPYAWFDAPWQAPGPWVVKEWRSKGLSMTEVGEITPQAREEFCNRTQSHC